MVEENNQSVAQPQVQSPIPEQTSTPPSPTSERRRLKLPIIIAGIVIFFIIGTASAAFFLLPKPDARQERKIETVIPTQSTVTKIPTASPLSATSTPTPTPDPTTDWKTYTNTSVGFQIKYPNRYSPPVLPGGPGENNLANGKEDDTHIIFSNNSTDSFGIQVFPFSGDPNTFTKSSQATAIPPYDWQDKDKDKTIQKESISVANIPAQLITANYKNSNELPFTAVFLLGKNHGFILNFSQSYSRIEINQVLSTFKFTTNSNSLW